MTTCCIRSKTEDWLDSIRIAQFLSLDLWFSYIHWCGGGDSCVCQPVSQHCRRKKDSHRSCEFIYYLFRTPYCDKDKWYAIKYMFQQRNSFLEAAAPLTTSSSSQTLCTQFHTHTATVAMRSCSLVPWSEVCLVEHLFGIIYYIYSTIKHTWTWSILFVSRSRSSRPGSCSAYQSIAETHYSLVVHETALRDKSRLHGFNGMIWNFLSLSLFRWKCLARRFSHTRNYDNHTFSRRSKNYIQCPQLATRIGNEICNFIRHTNAARASRLFGGGLRHIGVHTRLEMPAICTESHSPQFIWWAPLLLLYLIVHVLVIESYVHHSPITMMLRW